LATWTSGADLRRDDGREVARLDHVIQHVLAVARTVLQSAEELDDLRRQPRDPGLVGGLLACLPDDEIDFGACLGDDFLDPTGMDAPISDELRDRDPGDLATNRVETTQDDRLRGVVDDQVDAGGLFEGADVATLPADDPALHLVGWQVDHTDGVLRRVVGGDALHRGQDDVPGLVLSLLARRALDRSRQLHGVVLGLRPDGVQQHRLGIVRAHARDLARGRSPALASRGPDLLRLVEFALPRSRSLRSRCSSISVRWSSCSSRWISRRSWEASSFRRARASSSASRPRRSFSSFASRMSSFWRVRASASMRRASACAAFMPWDAHIVRPRAPK
jgi:hypothetical protein